MQVNLNGEREKAMTLTGGSQGKWMHAVLSIMMRGRDVEGGHFMGKGYQS